MMLDNLPVEIYDALYQLGLTANYTGFFHIAYAVHLAVQSPQRLRLVTKWLYPDVAAYYNTTQYIAVAANDTTPAAVERNIRLSVARVWSETPDLLMKLSHTPLSEKPSNAKFLALLVSQLSHAPSREGTAAVAGRSCLSG